MLDQIIGLLLFGLGLKSTPSSVLGEDTGMEASSSASKMTTQENVEFQTERATREAQIRKVTESRTKELHATFLKRHEERLEKDKTTKVVLEAKVKSFKDTKKRQKLLAFSTKFQEITTRRFTHMQTKLESLSALLDRITAASGALKSQGKDVSAIESAVANAQTKVTNAISLVSTLASSVSTSFSVRSEEQAKEDVMKAVESMKAQIEPAHNALTQAHRAVGRALESLEAMTDVIEEESP